MYTLDAESRDDVRALSDIPQSSPGAPHPVVLAGEFGVVLAYIVNEPDPLWDGTWVRSVGRNTSGMLIAVIGFPLCHAVMFGSPNDETLHGHPLYERGLAHYGAYEVLRSTWVRRLERMNAVHRSHQPERYASCRHFIFSFHDSTFECVANDLQIATRRGSLDDVFAQAYRDGGRAT